MNADTPFEIERDGKHIAGAYPHPRKVGFWLAAVPPIDWRDSGLKTFKTRAGAVRFVEKRAATPDPDDDSLNDIAAENQAARDDEWAEAASEGAPNPSQAFPSQKRLENDMTFILPFEVSGKIGRRAQIMAKRDLYRSKCTTLSPFRPIDFLTTDYRRMARLPHQSIRECARRASKAAQS